MEDKINCTHIPLLTPAGVIHWLTECAGEKKCLECPYNNGDAYEGCAVLLRDAALLLIAAYGKEDRK